MVSMICLGLTACGEKKAAKAETTDDVAKLAEYNDLNDGDPYQYNGHWSWIYFDNNEADCDEHGEKVWQWIGEQVK